MRTLRVAFLLEQAWHRVPGGTAVAAIESAKALSRRVDVDLVGLTARHQVGNVPPAFVGLDSETTLQSAASLLPRQVLYETWHRIRRPRVDRMAGWPDLVHASGGAVPATEAPLVATIHDLAWRRHPEAATRRGRKVFEGWLSDSRRADRVVCPSETTRSDLMAAGFNDDQIRVVPLGVTLSDAEPGLTTRLRVRHDLAEPFVLWMGTLEPRKNLDRLVAAMSISKRLVDVPLVLVGPEGWRTDVARTVAPLKGRAVVVGPVGEVEKRAWLEAADVFCFPSLHEGFGLPVLEAMACGTPVVTSKGTATEEFLGNGGLLVDPTDVGAIAESLTTVLDDNELAVRLGSAGRDRSLDYPWSKTADGLVAIYHELLS
ncbi:MAG: glycosyltransferase family 1 protein [Acidimicrobiales bacterium]|nr:glycosyltransferase family 1 protein [Acidimicrobiales bacterium]